MRFLDSFQKLIRDEENDFYPDSLEHASMEEERVYSAPRRETNYSVSSKKEKPTYALRQEKINKGSHMPSMNIENEQRPAVVVIKITSLGAATVAADHLRQGRTIICNFEEIDSSVAMRASDFIRGAATVLSANYCAVNPKITVFVPSGVSLYTEAENHPEASHTMMPDTVPYK